MIDDPENDKTLEALFKAARDNPVEPRPEFVARLIEDAEAVAPARTAAPSPSNDSLWMRVTRNWLPASGLTAATVLGVWIGLMLPETQVAEDWLVNQANDIDLAVFLPGVDLGQFADLEADG